MNNLKNVLIIGTGEYVTGYTNVISSQSDKKKGVVLLSILELKRQNQINNITVCGRDTSKYENIKIHVHNLVETYPAYTNLIEEIEWFDNHNKNATPYINKNMYQDAINKLKSGDIVIVSTPDDTHYEIVKYCIEKKMNTLVTKPLVKTLEQHYDLSNLAKKNDVIVATEMHKRWDPMYINAITKAQNLGDFSFFQSYMSQPAYQLEVFNWVNDGSSDISYYLNSHHIDYHLLMLQKNNSKFKPISVSAYGSKKNDKNYYDTITLTVKYMTDDNKIAHAIYTSSWIAPISDVHSQQKFFYMAIDGEINIDQAHRGYTMNTNKSYSINPLFMNYEPYNDRFDCDQCYGFKSFEAFVELINRKNEHHIIKDNVKTELVALIDNTLLVTAILEAGYNSLNSGKEVPINIMVVNKVEKIYYPNDINELRNIVNHHKTNNIPLKCIGSGLSPNGIAFGENMISLKKMNKISIDSTNLMVVAEVGATVSEILDELDKHDLTLEVLGSITEQSIVGFIQTGSHGTGKDIGPIDSYVIEFKLLNTSNLELITINKDENNKYFHHVNCSVGYFGIITEVTFKCKKRSFLKEEISVINSEKLCNFHVHNFGQNKYIKYLYMPYTDKIIISKINDNTSIARYFNIITKPINRDLSSLFNDPLNIDNIKKVNENEIKTILENKVRYGYDRDLLTFNCGPKQLVCEVAIPVTYNEDIQFITELMSTIKERNIPAHGPIEQRWSRESDSYLSPVYSKTEKLFSWIGIIMYLTDDEDKNIEIKKVFECYVELFLEQSRKYNGKIHLGKINDKICSNEDMYKMQFKHFYDNKTILDEFKQIKSELDYNNLFSVSFLDKLNNMT